MYVSGFPYTCQRDANLQVGSIMQFWIIKTPSFNFCCCYFGKTYVLKNYINSNGN